MSQVNFQCWHLNSVSHNAKILLQSGYHLSGILEFLEDLLFLQCNAKLPNQKLSTIYTKKTIQYPQCCF